MAIEDVLSTRRWEFDLRHDGQIGLKGANTGSLLLTTTAGSKTAVISVSGLDNDDFVDPELNAVSGYVTRVLPTGVSDYANTAMRIASSSFAVASTATITLETKFPTTNSVVAAELHYNEYILPDTVREVVRVSYQEEELNLESAFMALTKGMGEKT